MNLATLTAYPWRVWCISIDGGDKMAMDPICQMQVDEKTAQYKSEYKGKTYYFCAPGCKEIFDSDPDQYLTESVSSARS